MPFEQPGPGDVPSQGYAVLSALDTPVLVIDGNTTVRYANEAAVRHLGPFPERAILSARIRSPQIVDMVTQVVADGKTRTIEHAERVPAERWYEVRLAAIPGRQSDIKDSVRKNSQFFLLSMRDLTEARRMDRMRTDFVANASHEMRTPLASLMGFIETMQGPARSDQKAQERFLSIMLDQAMRMSRLIDDLLSLSRLEMRAHLTPNDEVDLDSLCHHVIDALRPMASEIDVEITYDSPSSPIKVVGDRDELIQVMENLVENACKYGQSGKRVEVSVEQEENGGVLVNVKDYGPGIERQHVPRLTERFYRVDGETSRLKKGTGLGLAIVKHILTRHGARLIVRSEPGQGSNFGVKFPEGKVLKN